MNETMTTNWNTNSGKKIEATFRHVENTGMVRIDSMTIDGKAIDKPSISPAGIDFWMGGKKYVTPRPASVNEVIETLRNKSVTTEAQKWALEQEEKYQAHVRKVGSAMSK